MRNAKGPVLIAAVVALSLGVLAAVVSADPSSPWRTAGAAVRGIQGGGDDVVARVGNASVLRRDVLTQQAMNAMNNQLSPVKIGTDQGTALQRLLGFYAISEEAYGRGLRPSNADVAAYVASMRAQSRRFPAAEAELNDFLAGLGMSADEYFTRPETVELTARGLAIQRLRDQVLRGVDPTKTTDVWNAFESDVMSKARITVIDPAMR